MAPKAAIEKRVSILAPVLNSKPLNDVLFIYSGKLGQFYLYDVLGSWCQFRLASSKTDTIVSYY
jgi:hypothetical protein